MKGFFRVAGTVVIGTAALTGKERLNLQQMEIVTPRTAEALGLNYENLWSALITAHPRLKDAAHGSPILVRITNQDPKVQIQVVEPSATLPLDKATVVPEKNAFIRA